MSYDETDAARDAMFDNWGQYTIFRIIGDSILFFEPVAKSQPNSGHNN